MTENTKHWAVRLAADDAKSRTAASTVANLIAGGAATTRATLARTTTGWAPSTVSRHVDVMLDAGVLAQHSAGPSTGGRPAAELGLNPALGLLLWPRSAPSAPVWPWPTSPVTSARRATSNHPPTGVPNTSSPRSSRRSTSCSTSCRRCPRTCSRWSRPAVPRRPPDRPHRATAADAGLGWVQDRPGLRRPAGCPDARSTDDANLMALGEVWLRRALDQHVLVVELGASIGAGIVSRGSAHRGEDGTAGEGSVISRSPATTRCSANAGRPVASRRSPPAGRSSATCGAAGVDVATTGDVVRLASDGDTTARRAVDVAAARIGEVLASVVSFYNPTLIVVGGQVRRGSKPSSWRRSAGVVYKRALPLATRTVPHRDQHRRGPRGGGREQRDAAATSSLRRRDRASPVGGPDGRRMS